MSSGTWGFAEDTRAEVVLYRTLLLITAAAVVVLWALRLRQKVIGTSTNGRVQHSVAAPQSKGLQAELPTAAETMHLIQKRRSIFPKASKFALGPEADCSMWRCHGVVRVHPRLQFLLYEQLH